MTNKMILLMVGSWLLIAATFAQTYTHQFFLDESFATVKEENAVFIGKGYNASDGFRLDCFALGSDTLLLSCTFTDPSMAVLQGSYQQFYRNKKVQVKGDYVNNQKQGVWQEWSEQGNKTDSALFENGVRIRYVHYGYGKKKLNGPEWLSSYEMKDSLADTWDKHYFSDSGQLTSRAHFVGNKGIYQRYLKDKTLIDTVFSREEREAEFPGGNAAWSRYIQRALGDFSPANHGAKNGKWQVIVRFIVDTDGSISEVKPETNFGHKMEETVVKMITKGPLWSPAKQFGIPVKAYRRQPVTFMVSGE